MSVERNRRKKLSGSVLKVSGLKTVSVKVVSVGTHPKYGKVVRHTKNYLVHDQEQVSSLGDEVEIAETRPVSKTKSWRIVSVVKKA